jgi:hypothetical protein
LRVGCLLAHLVRGFVRHHHGRIPDGAAGGVEDIAADGSGAALLRCRQKGQHHEDGEANAKLDEDTKTSNWTRFHGSSAWKWI